jgi:hypothetical protein
MKVVGILLALIGWLIPLMALPLTQSLTARYIFALVGIAVSLVGILGVLNRAHIKHAIWKG